MASDPESWWPDELVSAGREHFDEDHARRYDAKMDARAHDEVRLLRDGGFLDKTSSVVDFGTGTGQFATAVAPACRRVIAVDVSPLMLAQLHKKVAASQVANVATVSAGFLSYEHSGDPVDIVYSRYALHHLPDFWKALALTRIAAILRPGGVLRLADVVYSFDPSDAPRRIEDWISAVMASDVDAGWTRAELAEHVRDEHSTFTWLLEPMLERAGFTILRGEYSPSGMDAEYLCQKT